MQQSLSSTLDCPAAEQSPSTEASTVINAGKIDSTMAKSRLKIQYFGPVEFKFFFSQYPSHRIFGHTHKVLNKIRKITNYTI